jgi:hypothetical protein
MQGAMAFEVDKEGAKLIYAAYFQNMADKVITKPPYPIKASGQAAPAKKGS